MVDRRLSWLDLGARPAFFPAVCLALGAQVGPRIPGPPLLFLGGAAVLGLLAIGLRGRTGAHLGLLLGFWLGGIGLSTLAARAEVPERLLEGRSRAVLEGVVEEVLRTEGGGRVELAVAWVEGEEGRPRFRARLYSKGELPPLEPGQRVRLPATLKPTDPPLNPGQPDFGERHRRRGSVLTGGFEAARLVALSGPPPHRVWLTRTHAALAARVRALSPTPEAAALYLTLSAGLRAELGEALEDRFSRSGLAHVLSVSGLHVAILAVLLVRALRMLLCRVGPLARRIDVRRLAAPLSVPLVWGYVAFTGNQVPAVRSAVMVTAVLVGMALWRRADALNALSLALLILVAADPSAVADLSTRLSFLAVASLIVLAPALRLCLPLRPPEPGQEGFRRRAQRLWESVVGTFCASGAVTLASAPLIAHAFGRLSLAGLFSNVACLPLCAVLTLLAAGGAGLFVVWPPLAEPLLYGGGWASQALLWAADGFSRMPGASIRTASLGAPAGLALVVGLFAWALARGRWRLLGLAAPAALVLALGVPRLWPEPGLSVTFLGVGHGDAVVLSSGGSHALVDGGGSAAGADTGRRYVLPYLRHRRIDRLELAVLSHPHADHALGMVSTLQAVPSRRLWHAAGEAEGELTRKLRAAAGAALIEEVEAGHPPLRLGEAVVEVLWPPEDKILLQGPNDRSVVLRVRHKEVSFLLTGDIEEGAEQSLELGPSTVVKAPHHGSGTSSSEAFVAGTRPKVVVFCVGRHHRWGFPDEGVVERYRAVGAQCFRTDLHGAVRIDSDGREIRVTTHLQVREQASGPLVAAGRGGADPQSNDP